MKTNAKTKRNECNHVGTRCSSPSPLLLVYIIAPLMGIVTSTGNIIVNLKVAVNCQRRERVDQATQTDHDNTNKNDASRAQQHWQIVRKCVVGRAYKKRIRARLQRWWGATGHTLQRSTHTIANPQATRRMWSLVGSWLKLNKLHP